MERNLLLRLVTMSLIFAILLPFSVAKACPWFGLDAAISKVYPRMDKCYEGDRYLNENLKVVAGYLTGSERSKALKALIDVDDEWQRHYFIVNDFARELLRKNLSSSDVELLPSLVEQFRDSHEFIDLILKDLPQNRQLALKEYLVDYHRWYWYWEIAEWKGHSLEKPEFPVNEYHRNSDYAEIEKYYIDRNQRWLETHGNAAGAPNPNPPVAPSTPVDP